MSDTRKSSWVTILCALTLLFWVCTEHAQAQCSPIHVITGETGDRVGWSVSGAGDVNGDGYADLIVGALADVGGEEIAGRADVYSGQSGTILWTFTGQAAYDWFGHSVDGAGDVDNDGYADVIVGSPYNDSVVSNSGLARVYSGRTGELLWTFVGEAVESRLGWSVAGAGDLNNDGHDDVIVGAYWRSAGSAYVYSGQTGELLWLFTGELSADYLGWSVSGAGDVDNDGHPDVIVGATGNDAGGDHAGRAYVYSGHTGELLWTFTAEAEGDYFGYSVSGADDVDKDGYADLIVGAAFSDAGGERSGRAYVYSGRTGTVLWTFTGEAEYDRFGTSVAGTGDVNGDGYPDLVVGAPYHDAEGTDAGRAYLYSGRTGLLLWVITGEAQSHRLGCSVSGAGDVDSSGYSDLIVGASGCSCAHVLSCPPPCDCPCHGDPECDGVTDALDVVTAVNVAFRGAAATTDPPCPYEQTDVSCDGFTNVIDVVKFVNVAFRGGDAMTEFCEPCGATGQVTGYLGCKSFDKQVQEIPADQDCIEYQYDGESVLTLRHINAGFNCCPDSLTAGFQISAGMIDIDEVEWLTTPCDCQCLFDLDYEIVGLSPGTYTIHVREPYLWEGAEILEFTVDLTVSPTGSYCVTRDRYPWGTP